MRKILAISHIVFEIRKTPYYGLKNKKKERKSLFLGLAQTVQQKKIKEFALKINKFSFY